MFLSPKKTNAVLIDNTCRSEYDPIMNKLANCSVMNPGDPDIGAYLAWYKIGQMEAHLDRVPEPDWRDLTPDERALARMAYMAGRNGKAVTFISPTPDRPVLALPEGARETESPVNASKPIINLDERRKARKHKNRC
jgi:hypothetical protein